MMKNNTLIILALLISFWSYAQKMTLKKCVSTPNIVPFVKNGLFGYYDIKAKKIIIKPQYTKAYPFQDDHYLAYLINNYKDNENLRYTLPEYATVVSQDGQTHRINTEGKEVYQLQKKYSLSPKRFYSNFKYKLFEKNNLYGLLDAKTNTPVVNNEFNGIYPMYEYGSMNSQDIFIVLKGQHYGVINAKGEYLIEASYDDIENLTSGSDDRYGILFLCRKDNKKTIIDLCGNRYEF